MKYFFWIAFAVFLAASIPHVAYFFASFEPSQGPEGVWWWAVSYAIAISIDVTVYLLSWTAFQRYRRYRTPKAVWQHWLLIVMCTVFSWVVNWAYAKQFHSTTMLSAAESTAPWLTSVFPFMASAFPLLGIVYTMMAETVTETEAEEKQEKAQQLNALAELAKQTNLPVATLRRALTSGSRLNASNILALTNRVQQNPATSTSLTAGPVEADEAGDAGRPITGKVVAIGGVEENSASPVAAPPMNGVPVTAADGNPDKLQMTIEALRANPNITDEALAEYLALKRPASARFWRLKAIEILNAPGRETGGYSSRKTTTVRETGSWPAPAGVSNGNGNGTGKF
ncbi:MAG TPA: hypothetical protein VFA09_06225 [Ktedonobacteraceae bacterium]|jgi:hypothetical protein|nr:hypothetical protein [Ktedonobacteraceae bacterium]